MMTLGLLRLLRIRLDAAGYEVDAAESGEQALGRLPVFQPHLVITDLRMGGMDGMALHADGARTIQGSERNLCIYKSPYPSAVLFQHEKLPCCRQLSNNSCQNWYCTDQACSRLYVAD